MPSRRIGWFFALLLPLAASAADLNEELLAAARKGDASAIKALLAKGADVNAKTQYGATALSYACDRGNLEVVKLLLEHGADVNVKDTFYGETPLGWALSKRHLDVAQTLIEKGAAGKDRALMVGVEGGHLGLVKAALDKGGLKPDTLRLALNNATRNNRAEIAELLTGAGATAAPPAEFPVDAETLKSYAGTYKNGEGLEVKVFFKDGKLTGGPTGQNPVTLSAVDQTTFKPIEMEGLVVVFNLEAGKVAGFTLKQGGNNVVFKKVEEK